MSSLLPMLHAPRPGWQFVFFRRPWLLTMLAVLGLACFSPRSSQAQLAATYAFAKSTGTFSPLASGSPAPTATPVLLVDTGNTPALPLGFTFRFDGVDYTSVVATSDGYLSFNPDAATVGSDYQNDLLNLHPGNDPLVAGLWDDLGGTTPGAAASYVLTGSAPNRVFTFEWLNWGWNYSAGAAGVSFQIKLHEGSNQVEMVYRPEAGALVIPSASVGLRSVGGTGTGSFLSVSDLTTSAVASTSTSYNGIAVKPTAGLTFTFTPTACSVPPTYATLPVGQSFETTWTDACATHNAAGPSWRTTPLIGDNSWRRDDDGAAAAWQSPAGYLPVPVASQGSHAAVFHSSYAAAGTTGGLDLYANLSGTGTKVLTFDYSNNNGSSGNTDHLDVLLSTDGGATFSATSLLTVGSTGTAGYTAQSVVVPSTSATTVIRFQGTADYGSSDIGLDNVALVAASCPPATALAASNVTSTSASLTFTPAAGAASYTVTYTRQGNAAQTTSTTTSPVALSGLTPGSLYTVSVVTNCGGSSTSAATSPVTFTTAPANDLCASAQPLNPATSCTGTAGTVGGATTSAADGKLDVWYSFSATSAEHHVVVAPATGSSINAVTEIYVGSTCPGSSAVPLVHNSSSSDTYLTGLTPTQVYYVRVYDFYNAPLTPTAGAFTICVTQPSTPAPANDLCANAQAITPATPCAGTTGTVGGATANPALDTNDDVWYTFVATSSQHNILVTPTAGASLVTQVYGSTCPSSTSQALISNASTNNTFITGLTPTQTYRVRVSNFYSSAGFLTPAAGAFTICIDSPSNAPANDECAGAIGLTVGTTCANTSGTVFGSTQSTLTGNCGGTADDDVWYKFVATGPAAGITLTSTGGLDLVLNVRTGTCGSTTSLRCANQSSATDSISLHNLTMSQTYFVRVYSYDATPSTAANGTFGLCVVTPPACAPPTALTATGADNTSATLTWTPGAAGVRYSVEYGPAGFTPGTGTVFNTISNSVYVSSLTSATAYQFYVTQTCGSGLNSVRVGPQNFNTTGLNNLVVTNGQTLTNVQGTYDNVTVQSGGSATLSGNLVVNQTMTVQTGGIFSGNCFLVTGAGSFTVQAGAELRICSPAGIATTGSTGAIQVTGNRTFDTDASYTYNGTVPQSSGAGLPATVRDLTLNNASGLVLANTGVSVRRVLRLTSGSLNTNVLPVRLLSGSTGTALIDNTGGVVNGTVLVDRYVSPALNAGLGYRHLSAPVASAPVSQLGSGGSPIVTNPAFNSASATVRPTIVPYPTVFSYDESQVPVGGSTAQAFDQGFQSPASSSAPMGTAQGYTVQVGGSQTLTFSGPQNNGPVAVNGLSYTSVSTQTGWHLLGNPYPSPLDWSTLTVGTTATDNLQNLNGALYVFQSSGQYAGTYRTYQNGQGGDPIVASGQAFFVRTAGVGQSGTLRLGNANRVTTWSATNSTLYRGGNDPRPRLVLALSSPGAPTDAATIYTEAGATPAVDARYDAYKLRNPGAANLYSLAGTDELTINGLPLLGTFEVVVPLGFTLMAAGPCTLSAAELANFPATTGMFLRDNFLGTLTDLRQQPAYAFTAAAGSLASNTRFALVLRPGSVLATQAGLRAEQVALYPNPAHTAATLLVPAVPNASTATATLADAMGRTVWQRTLPVTPTGIQADLDLSALPTGIYTLRLQVGTNVPVTKRLSVE